MSCRFCGRVRQAILGFTWNTVRNTGVWLYQVNRVTGERRVVRGGQGGHQPVDEGWVETGSWSEPGSPPHG